MSQSRIKVFDVVSDQLVPLPVNTSSSLIVTNTTTDGDRIYVERLCMPAFEYPEVVPQEHLLTIQLSPPHLLEVVENGRLRKIHKLPGSISLAPSGVSYELPRRVDGRGFKFPVWLTIEFLTLLLPKLLHRASMLALLGRVSRA